MHTGSWVGGLLVDGLGDGAVVEAPGQDLEEMRLMSFGLLQGSRMRNIKTEYVSCPSCGRTLFNLQEVGTHAGGLASCCVGTDGLRRVQTCTCGLKKVQCCWCSALRMAVLAKPQQCLGFQGGYESCTSP